MHPNPRQRQKNKALIHKAGITPSFLLFAFVTNLSSNNVAPSQVNVAPSQVLGASGNPIIHGTCSCEVVDNQELLLEDEQSKIIFICLKSNINVTCYNELFLTSIY